MDPGQTLLIAVLFACAALLYASVGHAGASAYLAVMGVFGLAPEVMRPTALVLNVLVAAIATARFYRAGCFRWRLFWPFALASVPASFVGGGIVLPTELYKAVVGAVLLYAAARMLRSPQGREAAHPAPPPVPVALLVGAGLGLLSGLTGVGGGIFLSPLLLMAGWSGVRDASGVAAPFILVNSVAGLLGHGASLAALPAGLPWWAAAVVAGGWLGAGYGSRRLRIPVLRRLLGAALAVAGVKLLLAGL